MQLWILAIKLSMTYLNERYSKYMYNWQRSSDEAKHRREFKLTITIFMQLSFNELHLTTRITSPIHFLLYLKNGKSNQHEIFTIAKSFSDTNNHVKTREKHFVVFTAFIRIWDYPQFQKLQKQNKTQNNNSNNNKPTNKLQNTLNTIPTYNCINRL